MAIHPSRQSVFPSEFSELPESPTGAIWENKLPVEPQGELLMLPMQSSALTKQSSMDVTPPPYIF